MNLVSLRRLDFAILILLRPNTISHDARTELKRGPCSPRRFFFTSTDDIGYRYIWMTTTRVYIFVFSLSQYHGDTLRRIFFRVGGGWRGHHWFEESSSWGSGGHWRRYYFYGGFRGFGAVVILSFFAYFTYIVVNSGWLLHDFIAFVCVSLRMLRIIYFPFLWYFSFLVGWGEYVCLFSKFLSLI